MKLFNRKKRKYICIRAPAAKYNPQQKIKYFSNIKITLQKLLVFIFLFFFKKISMSESEFEKRTDSNFIEFFFLFQEFQERKEFSCV